MATNTERYEYFRFPLIPTLLSGIFLILLIRVYWEPILYPEQPQTLPHSFLKNYSVWGPIWKYGFDRLKAGELPHWDPYQLCGHPYLVEYRTGLFQPLNLFFYLLNFGEAYQITVLISTFLLGISFIILGRLYEIDFLALIPGAIALIFSGFMVWAQGSLSYLNGCVWLSLLLNAVLIFLEVRNLRSAIVLLIMWCILILSGSMECILTGAIFMFFIPLLLTRLYKSPKSIRLLSWLTTVLITASGIAITSFYWLPSLIWVITEGDKDIVRWLCLETIPESPLFPSDLKNVLLQIIYPLTTLDSRSIPIFFVGLVPLTMVIPAFLDRESRKTAFLQTLIMLLCLLLYYLDLRIAKSLRCGTSLILIQSILILFSLGYKRTFLKGSDITSPYIWGSLLMVLVASVIMIFYGNIWAKGILIIFLITMLPLALLRFRWVKIAGSVITSVVIFLELFYPLRPLLPISYVSAINAIDIKSKSLHELRNFTAGERTYLRNIDEQAILWSENLGMYLKWQIVNGNWNFIPERNKYWLKLLTSTDAKSNQTQSILTASGVHWICSEKKNTEELNKFSGWRTIEKFPHIVLKENPQLLPHAFIVSNIKTEKDTEGIIEQIVNGEIDLSNTCFTEEELSLPNLKKDSIVSSNSCIVDFISPEHIVVDISSPKDGFLVLLDSYASGWKAIANGEEIKVYRTNGIFKGVPISSETHKVEFIYTTPFWKEGCVASGIALLITFIIFKGLRPRLSE